MARSSLMRAGANYLKLFVVSLLFLGSAGPAHAFYEWQGERGSLEIRGLLSGSALLLRNPDSTFYYNDRSVSGLSGAGRLMLDGNISDSMSFEAHLEQSYVPLSLQYGGSSFAVLRDVERSDLLDWSFHEKRAHLLVDRLNMQYSSGGLTLKLGRQPINLATTYYFTPNDFFAPFAAQAFFRDYKPGVDAVRADIRLAEFSQLSLISVLGYGTDSASDNGWTNRSTAARNAYLARASSVFGDFEVALLAGSVKKDIIIGGDFQGELFGWLGVRGEGHINFPDQVGLKRRAEAAVTLEHRWESSFTLRFEQYYHGSGSSSTAYSTASLLQSAYMGRNYSAVGAGYEFSPLLRGDMTMIRNWADSSMLFAAYARYSLSDASELAISASVSKGSRPTGGSINSEFGLYPASVSIEVRSYF